MRHHTDQLWPALRPKRVDLHADTEAPLLHLIGWDIQEGWPGVVYYDAKGIDRFFPTVAKPYKASLPLPSPWLGGGVD